MKAKVKETGEIIDVKRLRPVIYSRLGGNGKIFEEYNEDELELIIPPRPKMVSLDKACEWLSNLPIEDMTYKYDDFDSSEGWYKFIEDFRKAMEE